MCVWCMLYLGCQHGEVSCSITALVEVVGVSGDLGEVAGSMVELGVSLGTLQDTLSLQKYITS